MVVILTCLVESGPSFLLWLLCHVPYLIKIQVEAIYTWLSGWVLLLGASQVVMV